MDLQQLDRELTENAAARRRRDKLRKDEPQVLEQLAAARKVVSDWRRIIATREEKIEDLDSWSLGYLFGTFFGDRQGRIDDEKEQLLQAKLQHDAASETVAPLEQSLAEIRRQLEDLADVDERCAVLLDEKERLLTGRGDDAASRLVASAEKLGELEAQRREVDEAVEAGKVILGQFDAALVDLKGAKSWGVYDMLGGGLVANWAKHGRLDEARRHIQAAQVQLARFERELQDVGEVLPDLDLGIGGFAAFADWFFDGLIADWFVQSKITSTVSRVEQARYKVHTVCHELWKRGEALGVEREALLAQRVGWIEEAR